MISKTRDSDCIADIYFLDAKVGDLFWKLYHQPLEKVLVYGRYLICRSQSIYQGIERNHQDEHTESFGRHWIDLVADFLIPKMIHLSTRMTICAHLRQLVKQLTND